MEQHPPRALTNRLAIATRKLHARPTAEALKEVEEILAEIKGSGKKRQKPRGGFDRQEPPPSEPESEESEG